MKQITVFFTVLKKTFTSRAYYVDILKAPFSFSVKFFFSFFFIYALIFTALTTIKYLLPLNDLINFLPERLVRVYPSELEITIKDGQVSTNVRESYRIPLKNIKNIFDEAQKRVLGQSTEKIDYLLVIDTKGKIEDFYTYQTYILLTKGHLTYINNDGALESVPLARVNNLVINREAVENIVNLVTPFLKFIVPALVVATFLSFSIFYPFTKLFYLFFYALVLLVIGKLIKFPISYKKSYQLGLHLVVISTTLFSITGFFGIPIHFPFLQTIFLGILGVIIIRKIKTLQVASQSTSPSSYAATAP